MNEYPLLYKYISESRNDSDVKKLQYLPSFNEFSNFLIDYYSFNISREDAKNKPLNSEHIFINNHGLKEKRDNFLKAWDIIKDKAIKYQFNEKMDVKSLTKNDKLAYFLNDNNEQGYGMYIAAAYQNFIEWQNGFLEHIIKMGTKNKNLNYYIENMKIKIPVQKANLSQIILINNEDYFKDTFFENFKDIINTFSRRNIFDKDGKINYLNYNSFIYEIPQIEEELGKIILSGKCLFEKEDKLNFVTYWGEGFSGGNSEIMNKFYSNYKQKDLNDKEKDIIVQYIREKKNSEKNYDFKPFFGSIQLIIFYLSNNNFKETQTISEILNEAPKYVRINNDCLEFFMEKGNYLKVETIMNAFSLFEHLCFEDLCKNLQEQYKSKINEETQNKIKEKLLNNNQRFNDDITIKEFGAALRRFISRYLVGKKIKINDISESGSLVNKLVKPDLWKEKIGKLQNLKELISNILKDLDLNVEQSYEFYELIKEQDEEEINENNKEENREQNQNKKKRRIRI